MEDIDDMSDEQVGKELKKMMKTQGGKMKIRVPITNPPLTKKDIVFIIDHYFKNYKREAHHEFI